MPNCMKRSLLMPIDKHISRNFDVLKLFSIILVFFGHFFSDIIPLVWIPVTTALIVFSFSSGYFTNLKYKDHLDVKKFWKKKFQRLGFNLLTINCFLLFVFILSDNPGIWTWQTVINLFGLNGILNWLSIANPSPFGRGMWFFTLLIIFYAVYPALRSIRAQYWNVFIVFFIGFAYFCSRLHSPGHALYLTATGFIAGVYWGGKQNIRIPPFLSIGLCALSFFAMLVVNLVFKYGGMNFFFILILSISFLFSFLEISIRDSIYRYISIFSPCVLEIYLLHPYFSLKPTGNHFVNFLLSFVVVILLSMILNRFSKLTLNYIQRS